MTEYCEKCHEPKQQWVGNKLVPWDCACDRAARIRLVSRMRSCFGERVPGSFDDDIYPDSEPSKQCKAYVENFQEMKAKGYGLLLYGTPDQGKTFLAECIARELVECGVNCKFVTAAQVIWEAQKRFGSDYDPLETLPTCDLLILDDLGAERDTSFANETIQQLIDIRYSAKRPLIVTSNISPKDMSKSDMTRLRTYNRILGRCLPIEVEHGRKRANSETYAEMLEILSCNG